MTGSHVDVLVVGAGLSGVGAGYHLQTECPGKTYAILEARDAIGGTWDLFRYPGIRSDSDMYTFGYSFRPWTGTKSIGDGASILRYIRDTAAEYGIDRKVRFHRKVRSAAWSSKASRWNVEVERTDTGETETYTAQFLLLCSGYYDYDAGYTPDFVGRGDFRGRVVHPQQWTPDIDYAGKRVVIIGSGATAVTLLPNLAATAAHVTMLQRSPTYILSTPDEDPVARLLERRMSKARASEITRLKNVALGTAFFQFCKRFPEQAKRLLVGQVERQLHGHVDVRKDFTPRYKPWDERLCAVPNADLFRVIRAGKASVVTATIDRFVEEGIRLTDGTVLPADLVITATGLNLKFAGGMTATIDGRRFEPASSKTYKGMMLSDVPNLAFTLGYTNASWTLKSDLVARYFCRLVNHLDATGDTQFCPRWNDPSLREEALIDLSSGYFQRSLDKLPKQGSAKPWKLFHNYFLDLASLRFSDVADRFMEFRRE